GRPSLRVRPSLQCGRRSARVGSGCAGRGLKGIAKIAEIAKIDNCRQSLLALTHSLSEHYELQQETTHVQSITAIFGNLGNFGNLSISSAQSMLFSGNSPPVRSMSCPSPHRRP